METGQDELSNRKPKLVRLPTRVPEAEAKEVRLIVGEALLHFDRAAILDAIAAKVRPRKDLLSRDPKYKNRYDRDKITWKACGEQYLFRYEFAARERAHTSLLLPTGRKGRDGCGSREATGPGQRVMVAASFDRDYLRFLVTSDSFEQYIAMRRIAEKKQIPVGWIFADDVVRQTLNLSERRIWATPDPDWKPPAPGKGKNPPPRKKPTEDILD